MVGPMLLIKMLHCKRLQRKNTGESAVESTRHSQNSFVNEILIKRESEDDKCRVCLKEGNIPIYGNDMFEDISEELATFGSIEVTRDDPYPKLVCKSCYNLLQGAILFRQTALKSDEILKQPRRSEDLDNSAYLDKSAELDFSEEFPDIEKDDVIEYLDEDNQVINLDLFTKSKGKKQNPTHNTQAKKYYCKKCKVEFKTRNEYTEHNLSDEHENKRVACPICNKLYTSLYLKKHLVLHKKETPYMCDICGRKFIMQGPFARHRLTHFYKLPFQCELCPYKGRFRESLKMHMRSHTGFKPYTCPECPKTFISKSNLNKHTRTHSGARNFKCDACGKGFYTKPELEQHIKVDHTGLKDHVCGICGKAFGYRKQMMKHQLKVHKREKLRSGRLPLYLEVENLKQQGHDVESLMLG